MITPTNPAISRPPTFASTSSGSLGSGAFLVSACSMTCILCASCVSSIPVPRPVTRDTGTPVRLAVIALAAVVLPIPISPVATSVIGSHHNHRFALNLGKRLPRDARHLHRDLLKPSQASRWFRQLQLTRPGLLHSSHV